VADLGGGGGSSLPLSKQGAVANSMAYGYATIYPPPFNSPPHLKILDPPLLEMTFFDLSAWNNQ